MTTAIEEVTMSRKTSPVRLTEAAIKWARIASGYTGESMTEYVSRIVEERGREDAHRLHDEVSGERPPKGRKGERGPSAS